MGKINPGRILFYVLVLICLFVLGLFIFKLLKLREKFAPDAAAPDAASPGAPGGGSNILDLMGIIRNKDVKKETPDLQPIEGNNQPVKFYPPLPKGGGKPYAGDPIVNHADGSSSPRFTHQEPNGHMLGMSY